LNLHYGHYEYYASWLSWGTIDTEVRPNENSCRTHH